MTPDAQTTEVMTWKECQYLLGRQSGGIGRIGFCSGDGKPAIVPARYATVDGEVVIRSGDPSLLEAAASARTIALLVDAPGADGDGLAWKVLVQGPIRVADPSALEDWAGHPVSEVLPPVDGESYLQVVVEALTGTRYRLAESAIAAVLLSPDRTMAATITSI